MDKHKLWDSNSGYIEVSIHGDNNDIGDHD